MATERFTWTIVDLDGSMMYDNAASWFMVDVLTDNDVYDGAMSIGSNFQYVDFDLSNLTPGTKYLLRASCASVADPSMTLHATADVVIDENYNLVSDSTFSLINELHQEAFGKWVLDKDNDVLTLYKPDGVTPLKTFDLVSGTDVPTYVERTPQ